MVVYDWTFGAAIAVVMVVLTFAINALSVRLIESFQRRRFKLAQV
jgi:ABC-type spermidine/putrescine transport system permease subunit I